MREYKKEVGDSFKSSHDLNSQLIDQNRMQKKAIEEGERVISEKTREIESCTSRLELSGKLVEAYKRQLESYQSQAEIMDRAIEALENGRSVFKRRAGFKEDQPIGTGQ